MAMVIDRHVRPSHLVIGALAVLALMAAVATFAGGRPTSSREVGRVTPTKVFLPIPKKVATTVVDEAPAPAVDASRTRVARQPAAQTGTSQPAQGAGAATGGGGDTNVTVENGSNDTDTNSGGAHVGNNADVSANSSTHTAEDDGP